MKFSLENLIEFTPFNEKMRPQKGEFSTVRGELNVEEGDEVKKRESPS